MDPLTHTLTGVALSRAGLNRVSPRATWVLLLAANAPDIDVVTMALGPADYLHWHRHLTHAFLAVPFLALVVVLLAKLRFGEALGFRRGYLVALAGVASHPLLDWTNVYGIRLLLPFSGEWLRLDLNHIIDLWIWSVLLLALVGPALARLVSSEIGAKPGSGRGFAIFALLFVLLYDSGRWVLHSRAVAELDSRVYNGAAPVRVAALPGGANPLRWRGLVETSGFYFLTEVNLLEEFDPTAGRVLYKSEPNAALAAARQTRPFQAFFEFSQSPLCRYSPAEAPEGATEVECMDLRFGAPPAPRFVATAVVGADGRVVRAGYRF